MQVDCGLQEQLEKDGGGPWNRQAYNQNTGKHVCRLGFKTCFSKTKTKIKTLMSKTKTETQDLTRPILEVHDWDGLWKTKRLKSHGKQKIQHTG